MARRSDLSGPAEPGAFGSGKGARWIDRRPARKRTPETLLNHVKYPKAMAMKMGLMMPPQPDVNESDIKEVWRFMKNAAGRRLNPYKP